MNYYGVGTRFGGSEAFLQDCLAYSFWCMGDADEKYQCLYSMIATGDIFVAKKYYTIAKEHRAIMEIEALGIVTSLEMPSNLPSRYLTDDKYGVSVAWFKFFHNPVKLSSECYSLGSNKTRTLFIMSEETDSAMIRKVKEIMKYDF